MKQYGTGFSRSVSIFKFNDPVPSRKGSGFSSGPVSKIVPGNFEDQDSSPHDVKNITEIVYVRI